MLKAVKTTLWGRLIAVITLHLFAGPTDDVHVIAGFGVEVVGDVPEFDPFGSLAFDVIDAGLVHEGDAGVGAVEVDGVADALGGGVLGGDGVFGFEQGEEAPLAAGLGLLEDESGGLSGIGLEVELVPVVGFAIHLPCP